VTSELLITLAVAVLYLTLVRFVDVNEREPVWALAVVFLLGAAGACLAELLLGSQVLTVPVWGGALAVETTKLLALGAGILVFNGVARIRGWSEFSDVLDGLVYGITVGLGFSIGETFLRELHTAQFASAHLLQNPLQVVLRAAAAGLSSGVFGGVIGLGYGLALESRTRRGRIALPLLGLVAAAALDALFRILAHGNALGGQAGLFRAWLAVLLPLAVFLAIGVFALTAERRAIQTHLTAETEAGLLSPDDLSLLKSFWRRQLRYLGLLLRGRVAACLHLAGFHSRLVQLALLRRRAGRETVPDRRLRFERQAQLVRQVILQAKSALPLFALLGVLAIAATPLRGGAQLWRRLAVDSILAAARQDINGYWSRQLGIAYRPPAYVGPYFQLSVSCGIKQRNAEWCSGDRSIYYDASWLESFRGEAGDFAPAFVLAHEWGHLVQDLKGTLEPGAGLWQIQIELQADCYAGQWTADASRRGFVKPREDNQAVIALRELRDSLDFPWFRAGAHGDAGQRINAFDEGNAGRACDGADFWRRVHVDPEALRQTNTPTSGSLLTAIACRVGRFERASIFAWPEALSTVVTDAVQATFKAKDGVTVSYWSIALVSAPAAQLRFEGFLKRALANGYRVVKEGPVTDSASRQIGQWVLLSGLDEMVVIRNGQKLTAYEGPAGAAWEFGIAQAEFNCK
jgi:protease PrsW